MPLFTVPEPVVILLQPNEPLDHVRAFEPPVHAVRLAPYKLVVEAVVAKRLVVVALTKTVEVAKKLVEVALPNIWPPVHVFAWPRASEATTAPVVGEMVSVPSEFETELMFEVVVAITFPEPSTPSTVFAKLVSLRPVNVEVAETVNEPKVPTEVNEDVTTVELRTVPDNVLAGATTAFVPAAVISPLPFTVKFGIAVEEPHEPVFVLTVASVIAAEPGPDAVPSPVSAVR